MEPMPRARPKKASGSSIKMMQGGLGRLLEQVTDPGRADADEPPYELRTADG